MAEPQSSSQGSSLRRLVPRIFSRAPRVNDLTEAVENACPLERGRLRPFRESCLSGRDLVIDHRGVGKRHRAALLAGGGVEERRGAGAVAGNTHAADVMRNRLRGDAVAGGN